MKLPQSTALILVDVQQAFLDSRFGARNNPQAESNIARLLTAWRSSGRPIRHVVHDSVEPNSLLRPDSPGNAIQAAATPKAGEPIYRKHVNSAFIRTGLESDLRHDGIGTVVIVGLTTNHCVSTPLGWRGIWVSRPSWFPMRLRALPAQRWTAHCAPQRTCILPLLAISTGSSLPWLTPQKC
jgi:Isochorismatase family